MSDRPNILLLDDYPDTSDVLNALLELDGWKPITAQSIDQAIAIINSQRLHAVILEPYLREGSGLRVIQAAKLSPYGTPFVVLLTSQDYPTGAQSLTTVLCDAKIVKPVDFRALKATLDTIKKPERPG